MTLSLSILKCLSGRPTIVALTALSLLATSCSDEPSQPSPAAAGGPAAGGSAGAPDPEPVPIEEFSAHFADAWCDNVGSCCSAGNWSFDLDSCKFYAAATLGNALIAAPLANPDVVHYDAAAAGKCLQTIASIAHGCDASAEHALDAACRPIAVGTLALGDVCSLNEECAAVEGARVTCLGLHTSDGVVSGSGVCTSASDSQTPHGNMGDECVGTVDFTADHYVPGIVGDNRYPNAVPCFITDGLYCPAPGMTCQPLRELGQSCTPYSCVSGAFCDAGTCAARRSSGSCGPVDFPCSADSFCNSEQCELKRPLGAACKGDTWCQVKQCVYPETSNADNSGTCSSNSLANEKACTGELD